MIKRPLLFLTALFFAGTAIAQNSNVAMADGLRSNGKIFVVVAVILTIFAGLVLYLIRLDRKMTRLEKNNLNS